MSARPVNVAVLEKQIAASIAVARGSIAQSLGKLAHDVATAAALAAADMASSVAVELAGEGVPVRAIARALNVPSEELFVLFREQVDCGALVAVPPADWPAGSRRDARSCGPRSVDSLTYVVGLMQAFGLSRSEGRIVAALLARRQLSKAALHASLYDRDDIEATTLPKIVDTHLCRARKKLGQHGIRIDNVFGTAFVLPPDSARLLLERISPPLAPLEEAA